MRPCTAAAMVWLSAAILGCGTYQAGGVHDRTSADRSAGCLELNVQPHHDAVVTERALVAVDYRFGNTCRGATVVDLSRVVVVAMTPDGTTLRLAPYDPREEIRAGLLDGGAQGQETIGYSMPRAFWGQTIDVCVELDAIGETPTHPVCFPWASTIGAAK